MLDPRVERSIVRFQRFLPTGLSVADLDVSFTSRHELRGYRAMLPATCCPSAGRFPMWVTRRPQPKDLLFPRGLDVVGVSLPGKILLGIPPEDLDTAAGQALLWHEMVHQDQYQTIPDFDGVYEAADRASDPDRPWENPYELPAYQKEREVYCSLVADGVPAGRWIPLGVQLWGCEAGANA